MTVPILDSVAAVDGSKSGIQTDDGLIGVSLMETALLERGLYAETIPEGAAGGSTALTSQQLYGYLVALRKGTVVGNLMAIINTLASANNAFLALLSRNYVLLGLSANVGNGGINSFNTTGKKTLPLATIWNGAAMVAGTQYVIPSTAGYYLAILCEGGAMPSPIRGNSTIPDVGNAFGSGKAPSITQAGVATATLTSGSGFTAVPAGTQIVQYWLGCGP